MNRDELEARWFALTREELPVMARDRSWPVHLDHCFQRILLDNAVGMAWREVIRPPAYRNASDQQLAKAVALGEAAARGEEDLAALNRRSLVWRGKSPPR